MGEKVRPGPCSPIGTACTRVFQAHCQKVEKNDKVFLMGEKAQPGPCSPIGTACTRVFQAHCQKVEKMTKCFDTLSFFAISEGGVPGAVEKNDKVFLTGRQVQPGPFSPVGTKCARVFWATLRPISETWFSGGKKPLGVVL